VTPLTPHLRRNAAKAAAAIVVAVAMVGIAAPQAGADQLANERAEARDIAAKIATLGERESALGEQYDAGVANLAKANGLVAAASRALAQARSSQAKTLELLQQDALQAYVGGGPELALGGSVPLGNLNDALLRQELEQTFAADQSDALDGYQLAAANTSTARAGLIAARDADALQLERLQKDRNQVQAAQDQLVALQRRVRGKIAALVAEIQHEQLVAEQEAEAALLARQRAAAAAQAQAAAEAAAATTTTAPAPAATTTVPAASPSAASGTSAAGITPAPGESQAAAIAVAAAESRVGDPYVWGAAGPDSFDCSGLVMWSYDQAGIYLPHYSGSQYDDTTPIPMSDLEPGDLVFPANPGQHVAMYIGNGEIVQAPYTGADVQIVPLTSFFVLATQVG